MKADMLVRDANWCRGAMPELTRIVPTLRQEQVQILAPEPEAATVAELRRRDHPLSRPAADRLFVDAKVLRCLKGS